MSCSTGVGKHREEGRCPSAKKILPGRAEPRLSWSKSDLNDWHKEHTAGAIDYQSLQSERRSILLRKSKPRSLSESVSLCLVINSHVRNIHYCIEGRSANNAGPQCEQVCRPPVMAHLDCCLVYLLLKKIKDCMHITMHRNLLKKNIS